MHRTKKFTQIEGLFGFGEKGPTGWQPLADANLAILVGVTGVGKSRTIEEMTAAGLAFTLLPNRRLLTDHLIIGALQSMDGVQPINGGTPIVRDRKERFAYTARYRTLYAGGMAHALSQLWIAPELINRLLVFDGLRGVNEVEHAAKQLTNARFIALCAPDGVRVQRLLGRNDGFDQIQPGAFSQAGTGTSFTERFPEATNLQLAEKAQQQLLNLLEQQVVTPDEMAAKLSIVSEERRNYDPDAALALLQTVASDRLCVVDTVANGPKACAQQIITWIS